MPLFGRRAYEHITVGKVHRERRSAAGRAGFRTDSLELRRRASSCQTHRARQNENRLAAGPGWHDNELVFSNEIGEPIEPRTLQRKFKRLLEAAELPLSTRLHDLRHGTASMLLARGKSLHEIAEFLGHSSIQITSDVYAHLSDEMKRANADAMDEIFSIARQ